MAMTSGLVPITLGLPTQADLPVKSAGLWQIDIGYRIAHFYPNLLNAKWHVCSILQTVNARL